MSVRDENDRLRDGDLPTDAFADAAPFEPETNPSPPQPWPDPVPLRRPQYGPALPIEGLPDWCQQPVRDLAANIQCPTDYVAGIVLGVVSGGVMGRRVLDVNGYSVHPNLSVLGILDSGERKSDPFNRLLRPLARVEGDLRVHRNKDRASVRAQREVLKARKQMYLRKLVSEPECGLDEQIEYIEQELEVLCEPGAYVLMVDDVTPEKAAEIARDNDGMLRVYGDEGAFLQHLLGRYEANPAVELFLNGWAGGRAVVHRVSRDPIVLNRVLTSVVVSAQPTVVEKAASNESMVRRGGLGRFLMIKPKGLMGTRKPIGAELDQIGQSWFADLLRQLYRMEPPTCSESSVSEPAPAVLHAAALGIYADAFERVERRRRPDGDLSHFGDFVNKFEGHVLKLTLTIWAAEQDVRPDASYTGGCEIPGEYVERAVAFMEAQLQHQIAAVRFVGRDRIHEHAAAILDHLARHHATKYEDLVASRRDLYHNLATRFDDPHDLDEPLALLERLGWLRNVFTPPRSGPGRPPSDRVEFHPSVRKRAS